MTRTHAAGGEPVHATVLLTDLYQLTMITAYFELGMELEAVFEFFVRGLPDNRGFLLAAGLDQVLDYLENLRFEESELKWLGQMRRFPPRCIERLRRLRFTGDVDALPEGSVFFANEPALRVTAPLPQAQLVESRIINLLNFQTTIASKAARCRIAAGSRRLIDFGMRRAHGAEAALLAARACYVAGFDATATVAAGRQFGIPLAGTMAHSFIQAHEDETVAFRDFSRVHPQGLTLLIDTYDTIGAARKVVALANEGLRVEAVRLDSGDLASLACAVRAILDEGGCQHVRIFASGNLDEHSIDALLRVHAPVDGFGVGTRLDVAADAPYLDCVYKLQEYAGRPRRKRSTGKATWPGRKQVLRQTDADGRILHDVVALVGEPVPGRPLLVPVMRAGRRLARPTMDEIRDEARRAIDSLPTYCLELEGPRPIEARISPGLQTLAVQVDREFP